MTEHCYPWKEYPEISCYVTIHVFSFQVPQEHEFVYTCSWHWKRYIFVSLSVQPINNQKIFYHIWRLVQARGSIIVKLFFVVFNSQIPQIPGLSSIINTFSFLYIYLLACVRGAWQCSLLTSIRIFNDFIYQAKFIRTRSPTILAYHWRFGEVETKNYHQNYIPLFLSWIPFFTLSCR